MADVAAPCAGDEFRLWWLGQSGFLLKWREAFVLLDPYLSDSLTAKYAGTDKPHVRMTAIPVCPARLGFVGMVTASHTHTDHLDADTVKPILAAAPGVVVVVPEAKRTFVAERLGIALSRPTGLDDGTSVKLGGVVIHGVAAAHNEVERDETGRCRYLGYVLKFGPWTVYHAGDTKRYDGLAERIATHRLDVALLPINGDRPERRVAGNLDGPEAARLARDAGARLAVPMHYEMFEFNTADPGAFAGECRRLGQPFRVLKCGERWSSAEPPA